MAETRREEHDRLQQRTDELKKDHADLARERTPFNQADHDRHSKNLRRHQHDLAGHKAREADQRSTPRGKKPAS